MARVLMTFPGMLQRILVPVDFSDCSWAALQYAVDLAARFRSEIDILHVMDPVMEPGPPAVPEATLPLSQKADGCLKEWLMSIEKGDQGQTRGRLEAGDPCAKILELAGDYDLIVMGTHGRVGVAHLLWGSVAEKVVRRAPCPVLTVREGEVLAEAEPTPEPRTTGAIA